MDHFRLVSEYQPTGDQPQAILGSGEGVSGEAISLRRCLESQAPVRPFTMANVIQQLNKPALIVAHNKTLAAQLYGEMKGVFPNNAK